MVEEKCKNSLLSEEEKAFIADFYKYSFVGVLLDWIRQGMTEDYHRIARYIG